MVSAVGIVPVLLHLLRRNEDVLAVLSAPRVDAAVNIFYFRRVAVRIVAAANPRMVGHAPGRIELLVQLLILRRMVVRCCLALSALLRLN